MSFLTDDRATDSRPGLKMDQDGVPTRAHISVCDRSSRLKLKLNSADSCRCVVIDTRRKLRL